MQQYLKRDSTELENRVLRPFFGRNHASFIPKLADDIFCTSDQCVCSISVPNPELDVNNLFLSQ